jgi:hypothetical protein
MSQCPLCNQYEVREWYCKNCNTLMDDSGRVIDFFDDYSPYLDIDGMKAADGYSDDLSHSRCPHYFYCSSCNHSEVILVDEWEI